MCIPGSLTCEDIAKDNNCDADFVAKPQGPDAQSLGSYCGMTCKKCEEGRSFCVDRAVPGGLSGKHSFRALILSLGSSQPIQNMFNDVRACTLRRRQLVIEVKGMFKLPVHPIT
jgi:hypothetical protein